MRALLARDTTDWVAGGALGLGYRVPNAVDADFGTPTLINPVQVSHITIRDHLDNGWWYGALESPAVVQDGQPFRISTGDLGITWRYLES